MNLAASTLQASQSQSGFSLKCFLAPSAAPYCTLRHGDLWIFHLRRSSHRVKIWFLFLGCYEMPSYVPGKDLGSSGRAASVLNCSVVCQLLCLFFAFLTL